MSYIIKMDSSSEVWKKQTAEDESQGEVSLRSTSAALLAPNGFGSGAFHYLAAVMREV